MKKYLFLILWLLGLLALSTAPTYAAISFVNVSTSTISGSSANVTTTISVLQGGLLVLSCRHGSTFVPPTSATDTIDFASSVNNSAEIVSQYTGVASSSPFDVGAKVGSNVSAASNAAGPFTTTRANEIIIGMADSESAILTPGSGYTGVGLTTAGGGPNQDLQEYKVVTSTVTASTTFSQNPASGWLIVAGTFIAAPTSTQDALFFAGD
jgi:hypothetical protein